MDPEEAERFERHLAECIVCRDEVSALRQAADLLPLAAARYEAPPELRRRVVRALRAEAPAAAPASPTRRRYQFGQLAWLPRPALSLGVVTALVVAVVVALSSGGSGVRTIKGTVVGWTGTADVRLSGGHGTLIVNHMPPPPSGHIYEVWLLLRGRTKPSPTSTLFSVTSSGTGDIGLPGNLHGVSAVLVTPEPAGGSAVPTHAPIIVARLT
jgi:hypothetical protein